jgi:hypothetical protein
MTDQYLSNWDPKSYLNQFYATSSVPDESRTVLQFIVEQLRLRNIQRGKALEFGCGPTIWCALPLTPHVDQIHLADYLPSNLAEVHRWIQRAPEAHDWNVYLRHLLMLEGNTDPTEQDLHNRAELLRDCVESLSHSDINRTPCVETIVSAFDLVTSFYCIECISSDIQQWRLYLQRLSELVSPGGHLILASILGGVEYLVEGRSFPVTLLQEADIYQALMDFGFQEDGLVIRSVPIHAWKDEGFTTICLVAAKKP